VIVTGARPVPQVGLMREGPSIWAPPSLSSSFVRPLGSLCGLGGRLWRVSHRRSNPGKSASDDVQLWPLATNYVVGRPRFRLSLLFPDQRPLPSFQVALVPICHSSSQVLDAANIGGGMVLRIWVQSKSPCVGSDPRTLVLGVEESRCHLGVLMLMIPWPKTQYVFRRMREI
jgi:hypothetical protein